MNILWCDDQLWCVEVLIERFTAHGMDIKAVDHPEEALTKLAEGQPDLLITDYHMPGMNGAELARQAKALYPGLPVLLVSGAPPTGEDALPFDIITFRPCGWRELLGDIEILTKKRDSRKGE